jgi:hypothetical protein
LRRQLVPSSKSMQRATQHEYRWGY